MAFKPNEHTLSFEKLKVQVQEAFDFAVAVDFGISALKRQVTLLEKGTIDSLPRREYFKKDEDPESLKKRTKDYKGKLANYLFISSFAFFESYIGNVVHELVRLNFTEISKEDIQIKLSNNSLKKPKSRLNSKTISSHIDKYKKYSKVLQSEGYLHPKKLLTSIALNNLLDRVDSLSAYDIIPFLKNYLYLNISTERSKKFGDYRGLRNQIAHGDNPQITLKKVQEMNDFLRILALEIDEHVKAHFVLPINYQE